MMGTSSEDVLLMTGHVRHKKNDGTLYLMAERVAWMLESKDTFSISHKYADIKIQKISPEGRPKVQLQVILHNNESTTFHFVNPLGVDAQLQDRNEVKELLQQLLPKFKRRVSKELEEKNKILNENPTLFQLYRDLVMSQVISSEEFWANYALQNKKPVSNNVAQDVGVSAAFLADIRPQTDGSNGIKYNISAEVIDSIFKTYPAVKKKHMDNVPHKLSDSEFWTKFFQSHYFHRDRLNIGSKDIFSECVKADEQDIKVAIKEKVTHPFIDISSFSDNVLEEFNKDEASSSNTSQTGVNQSVMWRFNHHSMMVLQSCSSKPSELLQSKNGAVATNNLPTSSNCIENKSKRDLVEEKTEYEDLQGDASPSTSVMNLDRPDRYFHGPTPVNEAEYLSQDDILYAGNKLYGCVSSWQPNLPCVLLPNAAIQGLGELLPGGALMKNVDGASLKDSVPVEIQNELNQLYTALSELLRHFWLCFPTTTPQLSEKVIRVHESLQRFQYTKLEPFKEKIVRHHVPSNLTDHIMTVLEVAYNKFSTWQRRQGCS